MIRYFGEEICCRCFLLPLLPAEGQTQKPGALTWRDGITPDRASRLPQPSLVRRTVPSCCYCLFPAIWQQPSERGRGGPKATVGGRGVKGFGWGRLEAELSALLEQGARRAGPGRWPEPPARRHLARRPWRVAPPGRRPWPSPAGAAPFRRSPPRCRPTGDSGVTLAAVPGA